MRRVSEYLKEERNRQKISLDEVATATKIKKAYLQAIEEGKFSQLPSRSYVVGFIKTYASFLGLPQDKVFAFLRREYGEERLQVIPTYRTKQPTVRRPFFTNTKFILAVIAFAIVGAYIATQYASLFFGPKLTITNPKEGQVISDNVVQVSGKTDPYATVLVNDDNTYVDIAGSFKKSVYVFSGSQKIIIVAKNRFGKETRDIITVKVE